MCLVFEGVLGVLWGGLGTVLLLFSYCLAWVGLWVLLGGLFCGVVVFFVVGVLSLGS